MPNPRTPRKSIKLTPGKAKQVEEALTLLAAHYGEVIALWPQLTAEQRQGVLAHSPLLAKLAALTAPLREERHARDY